jgi:Cu(I)/Ag(I) efflux system membrane fusion protein
MNKRGILIKSIIIVIMVTVGHGPVPQIHIYAQTDKGSVEKEEGEISYWTCGMHPSVRVTDAEYKKGKTNCPICNMPLIPAYGEEKQPKEGVQKEAQGHYYGCGVKEEGHCPHCDKGIPDAKCICGGHSFVVKDEKMNCPVCGKELKRLSREEVTELDKSIVARVRLNKTQQELGGIKTQPLGRAHLTKTIRTVGRVAFDPELTVAQEEFLIAQETRRKVAHSPDEDVIKRSDDILNKSKIRLKLLGMGDEEIVELETKGSVQTGLLLPEEKAWVYADIYEYELSWIKVGENAKVKTVAYPGEEFEGVVKSISPVLDPSTRSAKVRLEVSNPEKKLKPEMYVDVEIENVYVSPDGRHEILIVPKESVLDTGTRKIVYVDSGGGQFIGKEVRIGPEAIASIDGHDAKVYPIVSGLAEGDLVVTRGNFLIDSQSQLTGGMSALWSGAQEIKTEAHPDEEPKVETKHRH